MGRSSPRSLSPRFADLAEIGSCATFLSGHGVGSHGVAVKERATEVRRRAITRIGSTGSRMLRARRGRATVTNEDHERHLRQMERRSEVAHTLSIAPGHRHAGGWPDLSGAGWGSRSEDLRHTASFWEAGDRAHRDQELGWIALALVIASLGIVLSLTIVALAIVGYLRVPLPVVATVLVGGLVVGALRRSRPMTPAFPRVAIPVPDSLSNAATEVAIAAGDQAPRILIADLDDAEPWARRTPKGLTIAVDISMLNVLDREEWQAIIALLLARTRYAGSRRLLFRYQVADTLEVVRGLFFVGALIEPSFWRSAGPVGDTRAIVGAVLTLGVLSPIVVPFAVIRWTTGLALRLLLMTAREEVLRADASSVALTRNPSSLAWALAHLTEPAPALADDRAAPRHLEHAAAYAVPPSHARFGDTSYDFPPVAERIARLRAIAS
jgi:Zn-dependent protease with chaperone function